MFGVNSAVPVAYGMCLSFAFSLDRGKFVGVVR